MRKLVVLDERWNSALTDLGVKIASVLEGKVACAVLKGFPAEKRCKELGIPTFYIEDPRKKFPLSPFLSLKKVIETFRPQVVLTIRGDEMLFSALLKKRFSFRLYRLHGEAKGIRESFLNKFLHERYVDGVILSSRKALNSVVVNLPKLFVPGAVDVEKFRFSEEGRKRVRKELKVGNELLFGVVGRLDPVKGHEVFLRALSLLKKRGLKFKAVIVGEEKNVKLSELLELCRTLSLSSDVTFIPERRKDIVDIMSAIDVGVVPSLGSEMIARVPLEFMACRRPVVVSDVGVLPEIVKEDFGIVVHPTPPSLAEGLGATFKKDLKRMGLLAEEEVREKYSLDALRSSVNSFIL
ncbi:glycosyltransferase family 4 protein [Phorcysia thermohydrogeniphila]|uniref:Glycosyltransferase involved in cell wall biosynthesis n=1 Tax=Phorcysia thermohydrogeniphila TaxID=936138 RepID=A0A4R1G8I1_9BACT|nr:glycosyltransferase family 4 protein [Phorcysia thermohydrogeniphila]TCK02850.1 glycosyltransferase involved in cell wall biosynthesis [Phorcysia thermohydrogeniphila]